MAPEPARVPPSIEQLAAELAQLRRAQLLLSTAVLCLAVLLAADRLQEVIARVG